MPISYKVLPNHGFVYVRYDGVANVRETLACFGRYMRDPDCHPGQSQLVDLSRITSYESDFAELLKLQAHKADVFTGDGAQTLLVYLAPTPESRALCNIIEESWKPFAGVVIRIVNSEAAALDVLGLRSTSIDILLEAEDARVR